MGPLMLYGLRNTQPHATVPTPAVKAEPKCPLCGYKVIYQGLTGLECAGEYVLAHGTKHCPNYYAKYPHEPKPGSRLWACIMKSRGLRVTATTESCTWVNEDPYRSYWTSEYGAKAVWELMP